MKKISVLSLLLLILFIGYGKKEEKIGYDEVSKKLINGKIYKKGEKKPFTGKIILRYSNGEMNQELSFKDGYKHGESIFYYAKDQVYRKAFYKNNQLHGKSITYYRNGKIKEEIFKNGTPKEAKGYYESGNLMLLVDYKRKIIKKYYENGRLYSEGRFLTEDFQELEGELRYYYESGEISGIHNFKNGRPSGETVGYYKNGNVKNKFNYKNGWKDGESISYYENGNIAEKAVFKDGRLNGKRITYYENGNIETEAFHDKRELYHGEYKEYYENGEVKIITTYEHGKFISKREF